MIDNSYNRKSIFKSKWLYIVSAICILASGAGVWGAFNLYKDVPKDNSETFEQTTLNLKIEYSEYDAQANRPVHNEPDSRKDTTQKEEETKKDTNIPYKGSYALPMGSNITKDYSNGKLERNSTTDDWRTHDGIDFGASAGSRVVSIQSGTVKKVFKSPLWGYVVIIDHGKGVVAKYCGLGDKGLPKEGKNIKQFDVVGYLGEIPVEKDDGEHLHFEIEVNGKIEDPLKVMNKLTHSRKDAKK